MYMDRKGQTNKSKLVVKQMNRVLSILGFGQCMHIPIQRFSGGFHSNIGIVRL